MIAINEVYENTVSIAQKARHGTIRIADFNRYANLASMDLFNEKLGTTRDLYKLGKAIDKSSPGMNKSIDQALRPFLVTNTSITLTSGIGTIPAQCEFIDAVSSASGSEVKWVPNNKIIPYLKSTIDVPTEEYPIYSDLATQIEVYPITLTSILLNYYRTPETVIWAYTLVSNRPIFNSAGSVNFSWNQTMKLELITRILGYIGITIRDTELVQYASVEESTIA